MCLNVAARRGRMIFKRLEGFSSAWGLHYPYTCMYRAEFLRNYT
jgi:hypothetical protein